MVRFKMLAKDVDATAPIQYRTWVVDGEPDFDASQYTGLKSGPHPFDNINAYIIYDDSVVADFNLPDALDWETSGRVLPHSISNSQLAIIGNFAYLFGGKFSGRIYRADINSPTEWFDTESQLPNQLYGSQLAVINNNIYLFGGNDGLATDHIFSASIDDPLTWTDNGALLPNKIHDSQLLIADGYAYLLGGKTTNGAVDTIFRASTDDPLIWEDTGANLPNPLYNSQAAIIDGYMYMFGGLLYPDTPINYIYSAPISDPLNWDAVNFLPYAINGGQFFTVGDKGYLITSGTVSDSQKSKGTRILRCSLSSPTQWIDTKKYVPGEVTDSQLAIINDRIFLFGGSGSSVIFANASELKYDFGTTTVLSYGSVTRTQYNATSNKLDLFKLLSFRPWITDYGS